MLSFGMNPFLRIVMSIRNFLICCGLFLLLGPTLALFAQPGGSFKSKSKSGPPGVSRPPGENPGGGGPGTSSRTFPGMPGNNTPNTGGRPGFGGPVGTNPGGPGGGPPGGRDPNQFFDFLAKGKEVIVREELDPRMQGMFDRMADSMGNTSGQISREQFHQYQAARSSGASPGFSSSPGLSSRSGTDGRRGSSGWGADWSPEATFRRLDQNGDGILNYDEMPDILRDERSTWDRDNNGFIEPEEYVAFHLARLEKMWKDNEDSPGNPWMPPEDDRKIVVYRAGKLPPGLPPWFSQLDTDSDAQVGVYEWKTSGRSFDEFNTFDRNADGFVTVSEILMLTGRPRTENQPNSSSMFVVGARPAPGSPGAGPQGGSRFGGTPGTRPGTPPTLGPGSSSRPGFPSGIPNMSGKPGSSNTGSKPGSPNTSGKPSGSNTGRPPGPGSTARPPGPGSSGQTPTTPGSGGR